MKTIKLASLKPNPDNPRYITEAKFEALKRSIRDFPGMMALRPMVVDEQGTVLGGNMRLRALGELGYEEVPGAWVIKASDLTEEQRRAFVVKDNVGLGEWDWADLSSAWEGAELRDWGLDVWGDEPATAEGEHSAGEPVTMGSRLERYLSAEEGILRFSMPKDTYTAAAARLAQLREELGCQTDTDVLISLLQL
jgi:hypothetical protein